MHIQVLKRIRGFDLQDKNGSNNRFDVLMSAASMFPNKTKAKHVITYCDAHWF